MSDYVSASSSNLYKQISPGRYIIPQEEHMRVPGLLISSSELLSLPGSEKPIQQVKNVAHLPGIIGHSIAMPDMHWGYGFAIGGVAATYGPEAVISPGGVGYDINCGVRVALLDIPFHSLSAETLHKIARRLHVTIPKGAHPGSLLPSELSSSDWRGLQDKGAQWAVDRGYGLQEDVERCESFGSLPLAAISAVSSEAIQRGSNQLGSIGSGNHFVEIGEVETLMDLYTASQWNIKKGMIYILIHCGSRGFGHQICHDTVTELLRKGFGKNVPDPQLVCAPISSPEARRYLEAMAMAANFAFANRQIILHAIRTVFQEELAIAPEEVRLLYDVAHNIAKFETHEVDQRETEVLVHRKGATRAFGPHHPELSSHFQLTGQPVLIPGDMARGSWILRGKGSRETFCSCCHGAGRAMSRTEITKVWRGRNPFQEMKKKGIVVHASSTETVVEEMPDAYKDVDLVVSACVTADLADLVAKLKPSLVLKG